MHPIITILSHFGCNTVHTAYYVSGPPHPHVLPFVCYIYGLVTPWIGAYAFALPSCRVPLQFSSFTLIQNLQVAIFCTRGQDHCISHVITLKMWSISSSRVARIFTISSPSFILLHNPYMEKREDKIKLSFLLFLQIWGTHSSHIWICTQAFPTSLNIKKTSKIIQLVYFAWIS